VGGNDVHGVSLEVLPAIRYVSPLPGGVVGTGHPTLAWSRCPGADRYRVLFSEANSFLLSRSVVTADTSLRVVPGLWGNGDRARWAVYGLAGEERVGGTEVIATFEVRSR
jgi:hypothetical protein